MVEPMWSQSVTSSDDRSAIRSQIATASKRNVRYRPYAFTGHGAIVTAGMLNTPRCQGKAWHRGPPSLECEGSTPLWFASALAFRWWLFEAQGKGTAKAASSLRTPQVRSWCEGPGVSDADGMSAALVHRLVSSCYRRYGSTGSTSKPAILK